MGTFDVHRTARIAIVSAIYIALTLISAPFSYGQIQFRISEALVLLCFYNKDYILSMTLGCFIANLFSPLGLIDAGFGTAATFIAVVFIYLLRNKLNLYFISLFPVVVNAIIVAIELKMIYDMPVLVSMGWVALGEFICVSVLGVIQFKALSKSNQFMKLIAANSD